MALLEKHHHQWRHHHPRGNLHGLRLNQMCRGRQHGLRWEAWQSGPLFMQQLEQDHHLLHFIHIQKIGFLPLHNLTCLLHYRGLLFQNPNGLHSLMSQGILK